TSSPCSRSSSFAYFLPLSLSCSCLSLCFFLSLDSLSWSASSVCMASPSRYFQSVAVPPPHESRRSARGLHSAATTDNTDLGHGSVIHKALRAAAPASGAPVCCCKGDAMNARNAKLAAALLAVGAGVAPRLAHAQREIYRDEERG